MMNNFRERIDGLRAALIRTILELLADNGLKELKLSYRQSDHIFVIWYSDNGDPYECTVRKVISGHDGITVVATCDEVEGDLEICSRSELGARNLDWLCEIYENMQTTLEEMSKSQN